MSTPGPMTARIEAVVIEYGGWVGYPERRQSRCHALAQDGATADEVALICEHEAKAAKFDPNALGKRLNAVLTVAEWRNALKAARGAEKRKPEPPAEPYPNMDPNGPEFHRGSNAGYAYTRVHFDGRTEAEVAAELGIDIPELAVLISEGRAHYQSQKEEA